MKEPLKIKYALQLLSLYKYILFFSILLVICELKVFINYEMWVLIMHVRQLRSKFTIFFVFKYPCRKFWITSQQVMIQHTHYLEIRHVGIPLIAKNSLNTKFYLRSCILKSCILKPKLISLNRHHFYGLTLLKINYFHKNIFYSHLKSNWSWS